MIWLRRSTNCICHHCPGYGGDPVSSLSPLPRGQGHSEGDWAAWKIATRCGFFLAGGVLPEKCGASVRHPRTAGGHRHCGCHAPPPVETPDAAVHCRRHGFIHDPGADDFLISDTKRHIGQQGRKRCSPLGLHRPACQKDFLTRGSQDLWVLLCAVTPSVKVIIFTQQSNKRLLCTIYNERAGFLFWVMRITFDEFSLIS